MGKNDKIISIKSNSFTNTINDSITNILYQRELSYFSSNDTFHCHSSFISRLKCNQILKAHDGCVNCLHWNKSGNLLLSGSDDKKIVIWDYNLHKKRKIFDSNHSSNIFGVCFIPETDDQMIASGSMDHKVNIHYAPFNNKTDMSYNVHKGRVKDVVSSYKLPKLFYSVGEDGIIYQFDIRDLPLKNNNKLDTSSSSSKIFIKLPLKNNNNEETILDHSNIFSTKNIRCMGLAINPSDSTKFAVATGDNYTRIYDIRMIKNNHKYSVPLAMFTPPHLHKTLNKSDNVIPNHFREKYSEHHGTSVQFNKSGTELIVNYHNEHIYLYKMRSIGDDIEQNTVKMIEKPRILYDEGRIKDPYTLNHLSAHTNNDGNKSLKSMIVQIEKNAKNLVETKKYSKAIDEFLKILMYYTYMDIKNNIYLSHIYEQCANTYFKRNWRGDMYISMVYATEAIAYNNYNKEAHLLLIHSLHRLEYTIEMEEKIDEFKAFFPEYIDEFESWLDTNKIKKKELNQLNKNESDETTGDFDEIERNVPDMDTNEEEIEIENESHINEKRKRKKMKNNWHPDTDHIITEVYRRYIGYCNIQTDIKEAIFFGNNEKYIVAGSDDGRLFIWEKETAKLVRTIQADKYILNCVQSHPFEPCLATSGIESVVRLWKPTGESEDINEEKLEKQIEENQDKMTKEDDIHFHRVDPGLIRILLLQPGETQNIQECQQS